MARLFEHKGKELLRRAGVNTPEGAVVSTPEEAACVAEEIGGPVVVKAQVWSTGRLKAGAIKFAQTPKEASAYARELFGKEVKGFKVDRLLVEEMLDIEREFYAGIIIDSSHKVRAPVVMFSTEGGVDIEDVSPDKISRTEVNVRRGLEPEEACDMIGELQLPDPLVKPLGEMVAGLYDVFSDYDARSAEINPLVLTKDGRLLAADCRISIDDASVGRQPGLGITFPRESNTPPYPRDIMAWDFEAEDYRGISFFAQMAEDTSEGGYIGYHAIGGGGALLSADMLVGQGLKLANYAETSGNPTAAKVYRIAKVVLSQPALEGYCLMGSVIASQDQWHHAHGLVKAFRELLRDKPGFPVVVLLAGNKEEEALQILREGLEDLPINFELYGRSYIHRLNSVAKRMKEMSDAYRKSQKKAAPSVSAEEVGMGKNVTEHVFQTGRIYIDEDRCEGCPSLACVKACSMYGGYLYRVRSGRRVMGIPDDTIPRQCTECCACEYECFMRGQKAISISLPIEGIDNGDTDR